MLKFLIILRTFAYIVALLDYLQLLTYQEIQLLL